MGITDGRVFDTSAFMGDLPEERAEKYIMGVRLLSAIKGRELLCDINTCYRYLDFRKMKNWACTCRAKERHGAKHGNLCLVTPEYAYVSKQLELSPELAAASMALKMWNFDWDSWDDYKEGIGYEPEYAQEA